MVCLDQKAVVAHATVLTNHFDVAAKYECIANPEVRRCRQGLLKTVRSRGY